MTTTNNKGLHLINQLDKFLKPSEGKNNNGAFKSQQTEDDCNTDIMAIMPKL